MAYSKYCSSLLALGFILLLISCHANHHEMHHQGVGHDDGMDHSSHRAMMEKPSALDESIHTYQVPDVVLLDQDGNQVHLPAFLKDSEPYALNFIFTTCTTICPILTASFSHMQRELGVDADKLQLVSITIDPEYDTPAVLKSYAEKARANRNWTFFTGDYETIATVEKAFNAYTADKMNHRPIYVFKLPSSAQWVRVDGLASGSDLAEVYRRYDLF